MNNKMVRRISPAIRHDIGDLVTQRPLPEADLAQLDPFLLLAHHGPQTYPPHNHGLPFGPHPHRGFETVTFILAGALTHQDNAGHTSTIRAGGVQWMTAGSGVMHSELSPPEFLSEGGPFEILQLWVNLPPHLKMSAPAYTGLQAGEIPALQLADGRVTLNLIAGLWDGQNAPIQSLTGIFMSSIVFQPKGQLRISGMAGRNVFLYVVRGALNFGSSDEQVGACHLVEFDHEGDTLTLSAAEEALILFGHGEPIGAPVVAQGPFVMNSRTEIEQAIRDYQAGQFGRPW